MTLRILSIVMLLSLCSTSYSYELPREMQNEDLIYSKRASIFFGLLSEAIKYSTTSTANQIRQNWDMLGMKNVYAQPISSTVQESTDGTLRVENLFKSDSETVEKTWLEIKLLSPKYGEPPWLISLKAERKGTIICDNPKLAGQIKGISLSNRKLIGAIAAKYGYVASIGSGRVIATPKFFRVGMNENSFHQALVEATDYYLGISDFYALYTESDSRRNAAAADLRAKLHRVEKFETGKIFFVNDLSVEAQDSLLNLSVCNRWSQLWKFLSYSSRIILGEKQT